MKEELQTRYGVVQPGTIIRIENMTDIRGHEYMGKQGTVEMIDDIGQLHGTWGGLAVVPNEDEFTIMPAVQVPTHIGYENGRFTVAIIREVGSAYIEQIDIETDLDGDEDNLEDFIYEHYGNCTWQVVDSVMVFDIRVA